MVYVEPGGPRRPTVEVGKPRVLEKLIRTLTYFRAWRPLVLVLALAVALVGPGALSGAIAADKDTGTIAGTVVVEAGSGSTRPVAGVEIRLTFGAKAETRRTGADGRFAFVQLLPGKYTVKVTAPDGMKPKGEGASSVALTAGETERTDFTLISTEKPTATPTPAPQSTPAAFATPRPSASQSSASGPSGPMPALVMPYASPSPAGVQGRAPQPSGGPSSLGPSIGFTLSPVPVAGSLPGLFFVPGSPTPDARSTVTPAEGDDVLASEPPRRLITSFEALRETAGGGTTAQLKSWATETSLVLGVPFRSQIDGTSFSLVNCGPASLTMVLVAFGLDVDPPSVRDYLNHLVGNYDTEAGTSLYALARIAREAGLNTFGTSAGLQGWTVDAIRDQVRAGHPVITLTKYRFLPGHFGSVTDFDHYIVITGLAGDDFVYNDAAYSTEYGYNLLISPAQLQRAWGASSVPRHAVAIGFGDSLNPLPIVPRRLTAESLASVGPDAEEVQAVVESPVRVNRGPAAEWLREQTLDLLGARTTLVNGEPLGPRAWVAPQTRIDPSEVAVLERPAGAALTTSYERPVTPVDDGEAIAAIADARDTTQTAADPSEARLRPAPRVQAEPGVATGLSAPGLALVSAGLLLVLGGGIAGWRRNDLRGVTLPAVASWRPPRGRLPRGVTLPPLSVLVRRLPRRR